MRQNYEMPDAPRSNTRRTRSAAGGRRASSTWRCDKGYKLSFEASSDHISTHMSYCNVLAEDATREALLEAFQKRHVYGATDNILADFRCGDAHHGRRVLYLDAALSSG